MARSLTSRPLDIFYIIFFIIQLSWTLPFGCQPFYPEWLIPEWAGQFMKDYIQDTNDPWMLGIWSLTDTPFEWIWTKVFQLWALFFTVPCILFGIYGLINDIPTYYPILIAYSSAAVLCTTTTTVLTLAAPTRSDPSLPPQMLVYIMPEDQKKAVALANAAFLIPPVVILVDMLTRTTKLIRKGTLYGMEKKRD